MAQPASAVAPTAPAEPDTAPAWPKRLAINFLFLSGGEFAAKLLTFAAFSHLARTLGPTQYGFVEFTLAVMVFFSLPVDLGLGAYGAREIARNPRESRRLFQEITGLRMVLSVCSMLALAVFVLAIPKPLELKALLGFYGVSLIGAPFLLQWFFQAHDEMQWVGLASIVRQAGFALLVLLVFRPGVPLAYLGLIECASVAATALFGVYVARIRLGGRWALSRIRIEHLTAHLRQAAPIGLTELAWGFMWYFSTVLLGFVFPDQTLGWFGASHRALMALHTFVYLYFFNLLPSISRCATLPHQKLLNLMDSSVRFSAWASVLAAALLTTLSARLMMFLYGAPFEGASKMFSVLVWILPVAWLSGHHRYILVGYRCQNRLLVCTSVSAASALVLGLVFVPHFGGEGAAWALLIANVFNLALVYFSVRDLVVEVPIHRQIAPPVCAMLIAGATYLVLRGRNEWLAIGAGCCVYGLGMFLSEGDRVAEFTKMMLGKPVTTAASSGD